MDATKLIQYFLSNKNDEIASIFKNWLISSPRFANFIVDNKDKIREKIKNCHTKDALTDLIFEIEFAYLVSERKHSFLKSIRAVLRL